MSSKKTIMVLTGILMFGLLAYATLILGNNIFDSSYALNPANVLTDDSDFATLQFSGERISVTPFHCPLGFVDLNTSCRLGANSSTDFMGWLGVDFTADGNAISDVNAVLVKLSDLNLGCTDCNHGVVVKVFTTHDLNASPLWVFRGTCPAGDNQTVTCEKLVGIVPIEAVVVGRDTNAGNFPDPAVYFVKLRT